jgi:hypothetical protein
VAKKRKSSGPSSSSGSKKKKAGKPAARILTKKYITGLESYKQVNFNPLKKHLKAHIQRLGKVKDPSPAVANALRSLRQVSAELSAECSPTMILPTP